MKTRVGVIGASGYVGGELLRILLNHDHVDVTIATSRRNKGDYVFRAHPNLRGLTDMRFSDLSLEDMGGKCDLAFTCLPHGSSVKIVPGLLGRGLKVIDLSADFRLKEPNMYEEWYHWKHPCPDLLLKAVYGLPELHREEIPDANLVSNPGCMSTAAILALAPLVKESLVQADRIVVDTKIGSSAGGTSPSIFSHHAERYGVVRPYQAGHHRHVAEIEQELELVGGTHVVIGMTAHAVNLVRGILCTCHTFTKRSQVSVSDLWKAYRALYKECQFVRLVRDSQGLQRLPDPKFVIGSNFCDIGFDLDEHSGRAVVFSAVDNLLKGAAGQAVQNMNLMLKLDEGTGLKVAPMHPL